MPTRHEGSFFEEAQHFAATQFPIEQGRACNIGTVNLENVFGQIEPDGANILHGTVPPLWRSSNDHVLALDAVGAGRSTSSHPVAARDGCTMIPLAAGTSSER
jgi:hypothetical protein